MDTLTTAQVHELLAYALEREVPWVTCSKLWTHASWLDLVETLHTVSPEAYQALRRDLLKP